MQKYTGLLLGTWCALLLAARCAPAPEPGTRPPEVVAFDEEPGETAVVLTVTFDHIMNLKSAGFELWQQEGMKIRKEGMLEGNTATATFTGLEPDSGYSYDVYYSNGESVKVSEGRSFRTLAAREPDPQEPQNPQEPQDPQEPQEPQEPQDPQEPQEPQDPQDPDPQPLSPDLFDPGLWRFLVKNYDTDGDGTMSDAELSEIKELNISGVVLDSLGGLQFLTNLESLGTGDNTLSRIDVSGCRKLQFLSAGNDPYLEEIVLDNPELTQTYFINAPNLKHLDITRCPEMYICEWWDVPLEGTVDFSNCPNLHALRFGGTRLEELDLSSNRKLRHLNAPGNPELKVIWLWEKIKLESLEVDPQVEVKYK